MSVVDGIRYEDEEEGIAVAMPTDEDEVDGGVYSANSADGQYWPHREQPSKVGAMTGVKS